MSDDNNVEVKMPSAPDQAPVSTAETPNSIPSVANAAPDQPLTTSGQPATANNTAAAPNGAPLTTPNGTPIAKPNSGSPQWSPQDQALRDAHPVATKINDMAAVLTGGRSYETVYDPNTGEPKRVIKPVSTAHLGMAIALEALRGALAGGGEKGSNAVGKAGVAGAAEGEKQVQQQQQAQQDTDARAARDLQTRWSAMDNNFKVAQNAKVLGRMDREDHEAAVSSMKPMLDAAADHPPIVFTDQNGVEQTVASIGDKNVSETDSQDLQKYPASVWNRTLDGTVPRIGPDGQPVYIDWRGRVVPKDTPGAHQAWDNTYTMVHKDTQIPLTRTSAEGKSELQPAVKALLPYAGIIPGVSKQLEFAAAGQSLNYGTLSKMTQQANDISMLQSELNSSFVRLNGDKKKSDPGYISPDTTGKIVMDALRNGDLTMDDLHNFQKAIAGHGGSMEPWEQIQTMNSSPNVAVQNSAPKIAALFNTGSDPKDQIGGNLARMQQNALIEKDKEVEDAKNPDRQFVPDGQVKTLPTVLQRDFSNLKPGQVNDLVQQAGAHPTQSSWAKVMERASTMAKANDDENIKKQNMSDKEQEQLYNYGQVGLGDKATKLTLDNAPGSFMVNSRTGSPIPLKMLAAVKPSQTEINREQFAKSALHSMDRVKTLIETTEAKYGPISGPISDFMAKHGLGDKYTQELKDYMSWAQSAATGAHVGGRFNVNIMNKSETAINTTMNKDQLYGAIDATGNVMQGYADAGGRLTVEQWKSLPVAEQQRIMASSIGSHPAGAAKVPPGVPPDYKALIRDRTGNVIAYRDKNGVRKNLGGQ